jgi:hypothetical protein
MAIKKNIIAFSSTHGTGKSYQCYKIAHHIKSMGYNVCVIDELARECPFAINQEAGWKAQIWLIVKQIKKELTLSEVYDYVIADRSIIDPLAYGKVLNLIRENDIPFITNIMENIYRKVYILDPIAFNYHISDGVRDMDPEFRINVHNELVNLHNMHTVDKKMIYNKQELLEDIENLINNKVNK